LWLLSLQWMLAAFETQVTFEKDPCGDQSDAVPPRGEQLLVVPQQPAASDEGSLYVQNKTK
jgi:hypothetical protein